MRGRGWFGWGGGWGRGMGWGRGWGNPYPFCRSFPWLPRCGYFFSGIAGVPVAWPYQPVPYPADPGFGVGQAPYPFYSGAPMETMPGAPPTSGAFAPQMTPEQELDFLKSQADMVKSQVEQIESRMRDLESKE